MQEYLKNRLKERSTWFGIGLLLAALGLQNGGEIAYAIGYITGMIGVAIPTSNNGKIEDQAEKNTSNNG